MIDSVDIPDDLDGADHAVLLAAVDAHLAVVTPLRARLAALARAPQQIDRINADRHGCSRPARTTPTRRATS